MAEPMPSPLDALRDLADRTAAQLVAQALSRLAHPEAAYTLTVHPEPARRALPPVPMKRRGRPPGRATDATRGRPAKTTTASAKAAPSATTAAETADGALVRTCRKCMKRGVVKSIDGRVVACGACGFRWAIRATPGEPTAAVASALSGKRPKAKPEPGMCVRCDHETSAHVGENGRCLVPRCSCRELVE